MKTKKIQQIIETTYKTEEYPTLFNQINVWSEQKPLLGLRILDATPVFRNTTAKYLALIAAGAEVVVGISDVMPYDPSVLELLKAEGFKIVNANEKQAEKLDFILDCAASFISWKAEKGYVELTKSGVDKYIVANKSVYLADSGVIKKIETSLGTGESFFRAMMQLGYKDFEGKNLVIYGSGKVGQGLEIYAKKYGMKVSVITKDLTKPEYISSDDRVKINHILAEAYAVVTATGVLSVVEQSCDVQMLINSKALLVNMGVEDEFGEMIPKERVLQGKMPLNFILEEPTHMKYIDATMALHNYGALFLNKHTSQDKVILPDKKTEDGFLEITAQKGTIKNELSVILE